MAILSGIKDKISNTILDSLEKPTYTNPFELVHEHDTRTSKGFLKYLLKLPKEFITGTIRKFIRQMLRILKDKDIRIRDVLVGLPVVMLQTILHPFKTWKGNDNENDKKEMDAWEEKLDANYKAHDDKLLSDPKFLNIANPDKYRDPEIWQHYSEIRQFVMNNDNLSDTKKDKILGSMYLNAAGYFNIQGKIYAVISEERRKEFMDYVKTLKDHGKGILGQKMQDLYIVPADSKEFTQFSHIGEAEHEQTQEEAQSQDVQNEATQEPVNPEPAGPESAEEEISELKRVLGLRKPGTYPIEEGPSDAKAAQFIKLINRVKTEEYNRISLSFVAGAKNDKSKCFLGMDEGQQNYYIKLPRSPYVKPDPLHDVIVAIPVALGYAVKMNGGLKVDIPLNVTLNVVDEKFQPVGKQLSVAQIVENHNIRISTIKVEESPILLHNNYRMFSHTENNIDYLLTKGRAYVYKNHDLESKEITIPDKIMYGGQAYPVQGICAEAFRNDLALKTINIPSGVTEIGRQAFDSCTKLRTVTLENPVKENIKVNERAFNSCASLASVPDCMLRSDNKALDAFKDTHVDNIPMPKYDSKLPTVEEVMALEDSDHVFAMKQQVEDLYLSTYHEYEGLCNERDALMSCGNTTGMAGLSEKIKVLEAEMGKFGDVDAAINKRLDELTIDAPAEPEPEIRVQEQTVEKEVENKEPEQVEEKEPKKKPVRDLDITH